MSVAKTSVAVEDIISDLVANFSEDRFAELDDLIVNLADQYNNGLVSKEDIIAFNKSFGEEFLQNTIQGYGLTKPYGYAGDFMMIDKIYTHSTSNISSLTVWDKYFHSQAAPKAVCNRKEYFKRLIASKTNRQEQLSLLNVASGPARDLLEAYQQLDNSKRLDTHCVEMDKHAIEYATQLTKDFSQYIKFTNKNIFRYDSTDKYDLIWSAGLFDYFDDKAFVLLLRRFKNWLKPGGEIVIGNFNEDHNPSRDYMEILGEWYLNHRTETQLKRLALEAGFDEAAISVGMESEQVNLFLHLKKS